VAFETVEGLSVVRARVRLQDEYVFLNPSAERPYCGLLRAFSPDVAHFHHLSFLGFSLVGLTSALGVKTVVTLHDRWAFCFKGTLLRNNLSNCSDFEQCSLCAPTLPTPDGFLPPRLRRDYAMAQLARSDNLVAPSRRLAEDFLAAGADPARIKIVSSGIDLASITPRLRRPSGPIRLVCAAYLGEHKGIHILIEALRILWSDRALRGTWRLLIAGDGPLLKSLCDMLSDEDMAATVDAPGRLPRADLLNRLEQADVAILPSICVENQPVWLLESLASGAALVASRVGGNVELVEEGVNGLLYRRSDAHDLAAALSILIKTPALVTAYSAENLRRRGQFDESATTTALEDIYREPPREGAVEERILACGLDRASKGMVAAVESVPSTLEGKRIRLIWWRWRLDRTRERRAFWLFSLGRRPMLWAEAILQWGFAPIFRRVRHGGNSWRDSLGD
jgi:glycosyltransferase involved in cell wall biosynthesis